MNDDENTKILDAWEHWKKECCVHLCNREQQQILSGQIINAFRKKFNRICPADIDNIFRWKENSDAGDEDAKNRENQKASYWANEFDMGACMSKVPKNSESVHKYYKDFVWALAGKSSDPKLKVIIGKLLGKKGIINGIAENYLQANHHEIWLNYNESSNNKRRINKRANGAVHHISIDDEIDEESHDTYENIIPDPRCNSGNHDTLTMLKQDLSQTYSTREMAFILAKMYHQLSGTEFLNFVQMKKTAANDFWNNKLAPKLYSDPLHYELLKTPGAVDMIKLSLEAEKTAKPFLLKIEEHSN